MHGLSILWLVGQSSEARFKEGMLRVEHALPTLELQSLHQMGNLVVKSSLSFISNQVHSFQ